MVERILILCLTVNPKTTQHIRNFVPGTTIVQCVDCGIDLYIAPSGQEVKDRGAEPVCGECMERWTKNHPPTGIVITEKARLEAKAMLEEN